MRSPLFLVISIDVEEEGLFSGRYPRKAQGVRNVPELRRLEFIPRDFGFPLTLLVTYPVLEDDAARRTLRHWQQRWGAEIGAHLHPWNTPPFESTPSEGGSGLSPLSLELLEAKIRVLKAALTEHFQEEPRSFRMGRFAWSWELLHLLPRLGFLVDSSMVPLTCRGPGRDNFLAPPDPFRIPARTKENAFLLEVPVTMVPLSLRLAGAAAFLAARLPARAGRILLENFRYLGAAGIHPAWFPAISMRLAAILHRRRGGRVLNLFLHSSELYPGGHPAFPHEAAVTRLVSKLRGFLHWLRKHESVTGVTLSRLAALWGSPAQDKAPSDPTRGKGYPSGI